MPNKCMWCGQALRVEEGVLIDARTGGDVCGNRAAQDDSVTGTNPPHVPMPNADRPFADQPSCIFPAWLQALGFTDNSWHNEAAGRATYELPTDSGDPVILVVWVAEEDPEQREWPEHRYHVSLEHGDYGDVGHTTALYMGDYAAFVEALVRAILAANGVPTHA